MRTRRWRPLRWLLGLPFLALLAAIGMFGELPSVQDDLTRRATEALQSAGFGWAKVDFAARDGKLSGASTSVQDQQAAIEAARTNWGVRVIGDESTLIQALKPYPWSIVRDGRNVITDGYGSTDAERKEVGEAAASQLRGLTIQQNLKLARGMPPHDQWIGAIRFAAAQMAGLSKGKANLDDLNLTIIGTATNPDSYAAVTKALAGNLPAGVKVIEANISLPVVTPYTWDASWKGGELSLSGYVPDEKAHRQIVEAARSVFPLAAVTDHLLTASGQPGDFARAASVALTQLAKLVNGEARLTDGAAELRGVAVEQDDAETVAQAFHTGLPSGFKATESVTFQKARIPIAKPFGWVSQLSGKTIEISGVVPDTKTKSDLAAFAAKRFAGFRVDDHTTIARGAPAGFGQAANAALDLLGRLDQGSARLTDTAIELTGHAPDPATADAARPSLVAALPAGFTANVTVESDKPKIAAKTPSTVVEPPKVVPPAEPVKQAEPPKAAEPAKTATTANSNRAPYVWDARLDHGVLTVSGGAPGAEARDMLRSLIASRLSGVTVVNEVTQADQIPSSLDDWLHSVDSGLKAIADLGGGRAHIEGNQLTVTALTSDKAMPDYIAETLRRGVPASYKPVSNVTYAPPPAPPAYTTTVHYDGLHVVIEGMVPDLASKAKFLARVKPMFPDRDFDDRTTVEHGAPVGWFEAIVQGLGPLSSLSEGELILRDRSLTLRGKAEDEKILATARQRVNSGLPQGYGGSDDLTYVPPPAPDPALLAKKQDESKYDVGKLMRQTTNLTPPECQAVLNSLLRGKLYFASGRTDLDPHSVQALSPVLTIAKRCPGTRVEISGYTDSDGAPAFNQRLSERRAQTVVRFLAVRGIGATRLTAVGYGEAHPIAPNDTALNKAKNRRIEFVVTPG